MTLRLDINITGLDRIADAVLAFAGQFQKTEGSALAAQMPTTPVVQPPVVPMVQTPTTPAVQPPVVPMAQPQPAPVTQPPVSSEPQAATPATAPVQSPVVPTTIPTTQAQGTPATVPAPTGQAAPVQSAQPSYSMDDLARAAMTLMDSGRMNDLQALLRSFGVEALPALPKEQYGAFATALRGMGARI